MTARCIRRPPEICLEDCFSLTQHPDTSTQRTPLTLRPIFSDLLPILIRLILQACQQVQLRAWCFVAKKSFLSCGPGDGI